PFCEASGFGRRSRLVSTCRAGYVTNAELPVFWRLSPSESNLRAWCPDAAASTAHASLVSPDAQSREVFPHGRPHAHPLPMSFRITTTILGDVGPDGAAPMDSRDPLRARGWRAAWSALPPEQPTRAIALSDRALRAPRRDRPRARIRLASCPEHRSAGGRP